MDKGRLLPSVIASSLSSTKEGTTLQSTIFVPHMGASLGAGQLDEEGKVTCPWHAWRFDVCDGTWCDNPTLKIDTFPVRIEGSEIQVLVEPKSSAPS